MMQSRLKRIVGSTLICLVALAIAVSGVWTKVEGQSTKEEKAAIAADQVIASIRTAMIAKPGDMRAVEIEKERGQTICEVEILAQDGKTYEVALDVATNTVIEVEMDDDDDDEDKDDKN
ncbi:MAG: hypothetical protein H0U54_15720 [Acidobacteria bacterium]|nr:hypothetical protein [Acidobacteriota bacterium]